MDEQLSWSNDQLDNPDWISRRELIDFSSRNEKSNAFLAMQNKMFTAPKNKNRRPNKTEKFNQIAERLDIVYGFRSFTVTLLYSSLFIFRVDGQTRLRRWRNFSAISAELSGS